MGKGLISAFVLGILLAAAARAQIVTGSVVGNVADSSGLPVAGAEIRLIHLETARERVTTTNERGDFNFAGLDAGRYSVSLTHPGFKRFEKTDIMLATGERLPLGTIVLEVGLVTETISVVARRGALVQTHSAERADVITSTQVDNLLLRGRNAKDLVGLLPGVVVLEEADDLSSDSNFHVMGNRRTMNNISIDGIPATDMGNGFMMKQVVSQDAVSEVKILISNYQAEHGRMSGSNIQLVTKSGTRDFHGLVSYFKRHEQFNANNFFNNRNGIRKPRYRFNTWNYNIGGPVYIPDKFNTSRDKLFFFWHQEFWPTRGARTGQVTVPTALERQGNFSQTFDLNN